MHRLKVVSTQIVMCPVGLCLISGTCPKSKQVASKVWEEGICEVLIIP